jgi:cysteinyl-tRNA synthetase
MLDQAREKLNSLYNTLENVEHRSEEKGIDSEEREFLKIMEDIRKKFEYAMNDDFNTSLALTHLSELSKETNKLIDSKGSISKKLATQIITTFKSLGNVFGILEKKIEKKIPKEVEDLIFQRERARKIGDFKLSDKIRNEIRKKGYIIEDTPTGPRVRKLV